VCLLVFVCSAGAFAQASAGYGSVAGTVLQSGTDGMPDALVVLSNPDLALEITMTTTDDGIFRSATVVPAAGYSIKVTHKKYQTWQSEKFTIATGQTVRFKISLEQDTGEKGTPSSGKILLLDDSETPGEIFTSNDVQNLPAVGRNLSELIFLGPAVKQAAAVPGLMVSLSQPFPNILLTDGLDTTDSYPLQNPALSRQVSQDAVESLHILSGVFPIEYGRAMGGIVDTSTKSGGLGYHGNVYATFRPKSLASSDKFADGIDVRQTQHREGVSVGGPVWADQIFFFVNIDAMNRDGQGVNRITNPLIANPAGNAVLSSNCVVGSPVTPTQASATQCAAAIKFVQAQMNVTTPLWEHSDAGFAKFDYRRGNNNTFSVGANASHWRAPSLAQTEVVAPNGGLLGDPLQREEVRFVNAGWTSILTPSMANDLHVGWYKDRISQYPSSPFATTNFTDLTIAGAQLGATQKYTTFLPNETRYQLVENFHENSNTHQFLAGGDLSSTADHLDSLANASGLYVYPSLTSFAEDFSGGGLKQYTSFNQTFLNPNRTETSKEMNVYGSDIWRATDRLTLSLGLRYERPMLQKPTETNTAYYSTGTIPSPGLDFAPRAGIAYMVNEKTVLRMGYGFYYTPFPGQMIDDLFLGNGLYQTNISVLPSQTGAPQFPNVIAATGIPKGTSNLVETESKFRNPYSQEGSVAVERHFGRNSTLTIEYLRSRGYKMWSVLDQNLFNPTKTETYTIDNAAGQAVNTYATTYWTGKNDSSFAHIYTITNTASSWYQGGAAQWHSHIGHGMDLSANYTWSHATDNLGPASSTGFALMGTTTGDVTADKGRSPFDQRNRGDLKWLWAPTVASGSVAASVINGWVISLVASGGTSQSATPIIMVQGQQFSTVNMPFTNAINGSGGWARVPFEPVGSLNIPSQYDLDVRVGRSFSFSDRFKATVSIAAFNLLNRQAATMVDTIAYLSVAPLAAGLSTGPFAGILKPVPELGTGIASQGYPDGTNARRCQLEFRVAF
jgi:hypothetical protein